jgi:hypothetical protein
MCHVQSWKQTFTLAPLVPLTVISPFTILLKRFSNLIFFPSNTSHQKFPISKNFNRIHENIIKQYVCAKSMGFKVQNDTKYIYITFI